MNVGKQFYALMQYSRFIRCGAHILHSSQPDSILIAKAAPSESASHQEQIVLVATNALTDYDVVSFDLSAYGLELTEATVEIYRTSLTEDCQKVATIKVPIPLRYGCPLRPLSITTFVVSFGPGA